MKFRSDLEGVRGIAVALVVAFHFDLLGMRGGFVGVDVFYVLSGFLITSLLLRELRDTGAIDLAAFYARRARRILPAAAVAIVVVLIAATQIVAPLDQPGLAVDAAACGVFVCNITFALRATSYFASQAPSPFMHFWSLGVEEQFYLLWPLLLAFAFRCRRPRLFTWSLCIASFAIALALSALMPPWAFFGFPSRAWQLTAGALVALYAPSCAALPRVIARGSGVGGLAMLAVAAAAFDATTTYPGVAAIVPTVGIALVIAGGASRPVGLLSLAPVRWLGRVSYSLYLYHWPIAVLGAAAIGELSPAMRAALAGVSLVLAAVSRAVIEEPFLRGHVSYISRRPGALAIGATALVLITARLVSVGAASTLAEDAPTAPASAVAVEAPATAVPTSRPGDGAPAAAPSATPAASAPPAHRDVRLSLADARRDSDGLNERGCGLSLAGDRPPHCELGAPGGAITVALIGDSHAAQWFPAVDLIARARGWRVVPFTKDSCIFEDTRIISIHLEREYVECERWRANVVAAVRALHPDLAVETSSRWVHPVDDRDGDPSRQASDMARLVASLGAPVALIADTPLMSQDVPACLSRRDRTIDGCATPRDYALTRHLARDARAAELLGATLIDPALWLCDDATCPAVIDDTIVYRDDHHLTATMARRLAPLLEPRLLEMLR